MPRLIWVFAGRTGHFDGFVMRQLNYDSTHNITSIILYDVILGLFNRNLQHVLSFLSTNAAKQINLSLQLICHFENSP